MRPNNDADDDDDDNDDDDDDYDDDYGDGNIFLIWLNFIHRFLAFY